MRLASLARTCSTLHEECVKNFKALIYQRVPVIGLAFVPSHVAILSSFTTGICDTENGLA